MRVPRLLILTLALVAIAAGFVAFTRWAREAPLPAGLIQANGRIEGDDVTVSAKSAGRIRDFCAREGDDVARGQTLVEIDDAQSQARVAQAVHGEAIARAQWQAAQSGLAVLELEVPLAIQTADAEVARAHAALAKADASEQQAARDATRARALLTGGALELQRREAADLAWTLAIKDVDAAQASVRLAEQQLAQARVGPTRIAAQRHEVAAMQAALDQARAVVDDARSVLADLTITAPIAGVVLMRMSDTGEVVAAGAPLLTLVDLDRLYLEVYVPEPLIGLVRIGLPARVFTDALPDRPFPATIRYISARAEFTPKDVQTRDERVKLVYAVKLYLDGNPDHRLTPGMPADAVIQYEPGAPWATPRR